MKSMNKAIVRRWFSLLLAMALFIPLSMAAATTSCTNNETDTGKMIVAVTLLPQAGFVESIAGDKVEVIVMVPPGASPHTYEVTPQQMVKLSKAKMYAKVGSPVQFEVTSMGKLIAANKNMLIVDCSKGIQLIGMGQEDHEHEHDHDEEDGHHHTGLDPHIWLSVKNAKIMVQNICDGLVQVDPANKDYYEENCSAYLEQLTTLDADLTADLAGIQTRKFIVFHPAFGYFAHDYDLEQIAVERDGKEPEAQYMTRLIDIAKDPDHPIRVVFVSPQFSTTSAEAIAREIGGQAVSINPLAKDFIANMSAIASAMKQAMQ